MLNANCIGREFSIYFVIFLFFYFKKVAYGSPAHDELIRGDVIKKIDEYDCRDIRHDDAQNLFKSAGNQIKVVVQR